MNELRVKLPQLIRRRDVSAFSMLYHIENAGSGELAVAVSRSMKHFMDGCFWMQI